jgi:hypothetical protein
VLAESLQAQWHCKPTYTIHVCKLTVLLESPDAYLPSRISNAIRNCYVMANFIDDISAFSKIIGNAKVNIA